MARLPYVEPGAAPEPVREALERLPPLNIFRTLAHAETAFRPYLRFGGAILRDLQLDPQLRELAILQVARLTEAEYEWVQHEAIGRAVGLSDEQMAAVRGGELDPDRLDAAQRAVLEFTAQVVQGPRVSDSTFEALREHLSAREVVELLLTAGSYLMLARVMTALELDLDEPAGDAVVRSTRR